LKNCEDFKSTLVVSVEQIGISKFENIKFSKWLSNDESDFKRQLTSEDDNERGAGCTNSGKLFIEASIVGLVVVSTVLEMALIQVKLQRGSGTGCAVSRSPPLV